MAGDPGLNPLSSGYCINGTAFVYVNTGAAGALQLLGYTVDGVQMAITENKGEVITDLYGPMTPQDYQDLGMTANITCPFVALDRDVLGVVMNIGDSSVTGQINTPGLVIGVNGYALRVVIASDFDEPWSFNTCVLKNEGTRLATRVNPFTLVFQAWPFKSFTATTGKDAPLWTRSML